MMEAIKLIQKASKAKKPLVISMSSVFVNAVTEERVFIISFPKLGDVFYLNVEHCKALLKLTLNKQQVINPLEDDDWMDTIDYYHMYDKE